MYPQDRSSSSSSERTSQNQEDALVSARCALALNGIRYCALLHFHFLPSPLSANARATALFPSQCLSLSRR